MAKPAFDPTKPFEAVPQAQAVKPAFDPSKPFEIPKEPEVPLSEQFETASRSMLRSMSLGASEPAISGLNAVIGNAISAGFDAESLKDFLSKTVDTARIQQEYQKDVERRRELMQKAPSAELAGAIVGAVSPVGAPAKIAQAIGKTVQGLDILAASPRLAGIAKGGIAGAGTTAIEFPIQAQIEEMGGFRKPGEGLTTPEAIALSGALGVAAPATVEVVKAVPKVLGTAGKKAVELIGATPQAIESYLKDPKTLSRVKTAPEIKMIIDEGVNALQKKVDDGLIGVEQAKLKGDDLIDNAKSALQSIQEKSTKAIEKQKEIVGESKASIEKLKQNLKIDLASDIADAQESLRKAEVRLLEPIKKVTVSAAVTDDVLSASEALKKKVIEESKKSYQILDELEQAAKKGEAPRANLGDLPDYIKKLQNDLKVGGKLISDEEEKAFNVLGKYLNFKSLFQENVPWPRVKEIIQSIDRDISKYAAPNSADFSDLSRSKLLELRRSLSELIKDTSPVYREQMDRVSQLRELQSEVSSFLGNERQVAGKLENIWKDRAIGDLELLTRMGQETGIDLASPLQQFKQTKLLAQKPLVLEEMVAGLPEAQTLEQKIAERSQLRRPLSEEKFFPQQVGQLKAAKAELKRVEMAAEQALKAKKKDILLAKDTKVDLINRAKNIADKAKEDLVSIGPFKNELSNINSISAAVAKKNPQLEVLIQRLSKMSGQDLQQMISDLRVAQGFNLDMLDQARGSRNTLFGALLTFPVAVAFTGSIEAAAVMTGLGGAAGKFSDRYGGVMAQRILDAYVKMNERYLQKYAVPTIQFVNESFKSLPPQVQDYIRRDFTFSITQLKDELVRIDDMQVDKLSNQIRESNISSINKAKALNQLNKTQEIDSKILKNLMLGEQPKEKPAVPMPKEKKEVLEQDRPAILKALDKVKEE